MTVIGIIIFIVILAIIILKVNNIHLFKNGFSFKLFKKSDGLKTSTNKNDKINSKLNEDEKYVDVLPKIKTKPKINSSVLKDQKVKEIEKQIDSTKPSAVDKLPANSGAVGATGNSNVSKVTYEDFMASDLSPDPTAFGGKGLKQNSASSDKKTLDNRPGFGAKHNLGAGAMAGFGSEFNRMPPIGGGFGGNNSGKKDPFDDMDLDALIADLERELEQDKAGEANNLDALDDDLNVGVADFDDDLDIVPNLNKFNDNLPKSLNNQSRGVNLHLKQDADNSKNLNPTNFSVDLNNIGACAGHSQKSAKSYYKPDLPQGVTILPNDKKSRFIEVFGASDVKLSDDLQEVLVNDILNGSRASEIEKRRIERKKRNMWTH